MAAALTQMAPTDVSVLQDMFLTVQGETVLVGWDGLFATLHKYLCSR